MTVDGVLCREWVGVNEAGTCVVAVIALVGVPNTELDDEHEAFARELIEQHGVDVRAR